MDGRAVVIIDDNCETDMSSTISNKWLRNRMSPLVAVCVQDQCVCVDIFQFIYAGCNKQGGGAVVRFFDG